MGELGDYYHNQYDDGNRDVIATLEAEEANLLHARSLARAHGWWHRVISTMQGLRLLYDHTGRRAEWAALVKQITPDFVDPATDGPLPGREEQWSLVTAVPRAPGRGSAAVGRGRAPAARPCRLGSPPRRPRPGRAAGRAGRRAAQRHPHAGGVAGASWATSSANKASPIVSQAYEEAVALYQRIGDRPAEAVAAFNLGHAYMNIPALRDLAQAERWYRRSLELRDERDRLGRGKCMSQLGLVAYERFKDARTARRPEAELLRHLNDAVGLLSPGAGLDCRPTPSTIWR